MAIAGLHNVSAFGTFFRDSQSNASRQWSDEPGTPRTRASSLLQMWRELEGDHVVSPSYRSRGRRVSRRSDTGHELDISEDADETNARAVIGSEVDHDDNNSVISEQSSDLGETERERVRQIFQEWMNSGAMSPSPNRSGPQGLGENECERVKGLSLRISPLIRLQKSRKFFSKNTMSSISLSFSAALLPLNLQQDVNTRCASVSSKKLIKNQLGPIIRRSFSTTHRVPGFRGMVAESGNVQSPAVPTSVPVRVANELLQAGHRYLDVRTTEEFSAGHVVGAVNVPFMLRRGSGMARNPKFLEEVSALFRKDDEIIVGCQLGKRSLMAASELVSAGFSGITDMAGGYAAWVQNGLPSTE